MKEIFEQYGGAIITVVVVMSLITIITSLLSSGGAVSTALEDLVKNFATTATKNANLVKSAAMVVGL